MVTSDAMLINNINILSQRICVIIDDINGILDELENNIVHLP